MPTRQTTRHFAQAARLAWIAAAWLVVAGAAEVYFVPVPPRFGLLLAVLTTAAWTGFVPGFVAGGAGVAARHAPRVVRRLLFWAPLFVGLLLGLGAGVAGGLVGAGQLVAAVTGVAVFASLAPRLLPTLRETPDAGLAPAGIMLTCIAAGCAYATRDALEPTTPLMVGLPMVVGAATVVAQVIHTAIQHRDARVARILTAVTGALGLGAIVWLASWLPELNAGLKLAVSWCAVFAVWTFSEPALRAHEARRLLAGGGVLFVLAALVTTVARPVPERFAGLDPRWVSASGVAMLSVFDDADGDGFYADAAGGNDCDDHDPHVHPLAGAVARSCLPEAAALVVPQTKPATHQNVLVVVVDALRADQFDTAEKRERFPTLNRIAAESQRFTTAYAPGNSTFTSLPSLLSGWGPQPVITAIVDHDPVPYSEMMKGRWMFDGVDRCTAFIVSAHEETSWLFDLYPTDVDTRVTETTVDESNHGSPVVPAAMVSALDRCAGRPTLFGLYVDDPHLEGIAGHACNGGKAGGIECYVDEIAAVDSALGKVVAEYKRRGMWDDTVVIFTADHGEAFGERGHFGHTSNVFDEQVRVPLWLRVPGIPGADVALPVSGLSVAPTARILAGAPAATHSIYPPLTAVIEAGASLMPPVTASATGRVKLGWTSPVSAIRDGDLKLVYHWSTNVTWLYDIAKDPRETTDRAGEDPAAVDRLRKRLLGLERQMLLPVEEVK